VSCAAKPGVAGLGRHLQEIVDALDRRGERHVCICAPAQASTESHGAVRRLNDLRSRAARLGPLGRISPARRVGRARAKFDAYAAERLPEADHLLAFNRQALAQFAVARAKRFQSASLVSGSAHVRRVARQHARAHEQYPIERSYGSHVAERYLDEYAQADRIYVSSRYAWESFLAEGIPEERLSLFPLTPHPRFAPGVASTRFDRAGESSIEGQEAQVGESVAPDTFNVVYVGSLSVAKGVPLLVDALRRLPFEDLRLTLLGGPSTRAMRRYIAAACTRDPRIGAGPGDPLPHLLRAQLYVHPSYTDGFSYGAAEALACGVPVIASEDTGMKDLIEPGRTGLVVPTGELDVLTESIEAAYRGEALDGQGAVAARLDGRATVAACRADPPDAG
jgi:glycosyltransferase involved in cell wall biosynthesis